MKQKKKKKQVNDKFNFDNEYIIGFSNSSEPTKDFRKSNKKKNEKKKVTTNKVAGRPKMNEKKSRVRNAIIKVVIVVALFVGAICFLCLSPIFNVQKIVVEKDELIPADTISSLSKIELYKNIFLVDKSKAVRSIEKNPYVNSVKIYRKLPDIVRIVVEERQEKYLIEFAEGKYAVIDGQGYILSVVNQPKELPILVGVKTSTETLINIKNNRARLWDEDLRKLNIVANIMDTAKNYELDGVITKIDIASSTNIKLVLESEQKTVYLGSGNELNSKIQFLKEILVREKGIKGEIYLNRALTAEEPGYFRESVN